MANETTLAIVTGAGEVATREAIFILETAQATDLSRTITNIPMAVGQSSVRWNSISSLATSTVADGGDAAAQSALPLSTVTFSPNAFETNTVKVSHIADNADMNIAMQYGGAYAQGALAAWNQDIFDLFAGFSNSVGASGAALTMDVYVSGLMQYRDQNTTGTDGNVYFACPLGSLHALYNDATSQDNHIVAAQVASVLAKQPGAQVLGVTVVAVPDLTLADKNNVTCAFYNDKALGVAFRTWADGNKLSVAEVPYGLGRELVGYCAYQVQELCDKAGTRVICKA